MPSCLPAAGLVRARRIPQSETSAPEVQIFWPLTMNSSPSRIALAPSPARSLPAPGSENSWHQCSRPASIGSKNRFFCSGVPWAKMAGPAQPIPITLEGAGAPARASSSVTTRL